jgi:hypothetical protein
MLIKNQSKIGVYNYIFPHFNQLASLLRGFISITASLRSHVILCI